MSTFFWLVGLVLAFVALFQILGLYNSILAQQEDLSGTVYQYEAELSVTLSDKRMAQKLDEILDIPDINVKISGPDLILENGVTVTFVQTILFQNEAERVKTYSGTLPNPNHSEEEHLIAVGRNRSDFSPLFSFLCPAAIEKQAKGQLVFAGAAAIGGALPSHPRKGRTEGPG